MLWPECRSDSIWVFTWITTTTTTRCYNCWGLKVLKRFNINLREFVFRLWPCLSTFVASVDTGSHLRLPSHVEHYKIRCTHLRRGNESSVTGVSPSPRRWDTNDFNASGRAVRWTSPHPTEGPGVFSAVCLLVYTCLARRSTSSYPRLNQCPFPFSSSVPAQPCLSRDIWPERCGPTGSITPSVSEGPCGLTSVDWSCKRGGRVACRHVYTYKTGGAHPMITVTYRHKGNKWGGSCECRH